MLLSAEKRGGGTQNTALANPIEINVHDGVCVCFRGVGRRCARDVDGLIY